ncbi:unnamed protein product [Bursaphelenchus okinawaensis]|uniref:DUF726 domain-containing protein n=1 Tax=Bursaphelenchus okinawaensis TaxID=465554 RepID=A0A811K1C1_9BILA|nr:unnamed protein product [Bursaphelenchus okinawaensis]CAG9089877.1 unnamed protein product [Bursaphelenchus okinawaensis]
MSIDSTSSDLKVFPSRVSSVSSEFDALPKHILLAKSELSKNLDEDCRKSLAKVLMLVLKWDFEANKDDLAAQFNAESNDIVVANLDVTDYMVELKKVVDNEKEEIPELVGAIKAAEFVKKNGTISLLGSFLLTLLERGSYDSRHRVLIRHTGALLGVQWNSFEEIEDTLVYSLMNQDYVETENNLKEGTAKATRERNSKMKKFKRYALIGVAGSVGGVLIGLTGGLAAPLVAGAAGMVVGTGAVAGLATTTGAAIMGSIFGAAGAGLAGYKMKKRVGAIDEFVVESLTEERSLSCVLCVSGWIDEEDNDKAFKMPWRHLMLAKEQYTLRYESKYLIELGKAIDYLMSFAISYAIQHTLMETALAGLMTAIAWPLVLVSSASVIDNPWNVCVSRAAEVGEQLADVLLTRAHGKRPITLIGFSLGARVIYHCLLAMSKRDDCRGIIEDVVLLGAPVSASPKMWKQLCTVVGGRIINGYCTTDWLLKFLYRTMSVQFTIAGTGPVIVKDEKKIVNINLSHIIKGHMDYSKKLTEVLEAVGIRVSEYSKESKENLQKYFEEQAEKEKESNPEMVTCSMENGREVARNMEGKVVFRQETNNDNSDEEKKENEGRTVEKNGIKEEKELKKENEEKKEEKDEN